MAEDDTNAQDLEDVSAKPSLARKPTESRPKSKNTTKCRPRIDQLAIPNRRLILNLYQNHANHLPREKVERIKVLLQELYAMSPEETEKYFEHLRTRAKDEEKRKAVKNLLKKLVKRRKIRKQRKQAYEFVFDLLVKGMTFAAKHQMPPLVSVRLRNMSDIILEQICDLRNVKIPSRDNPDQVGAFLIQVADWMAIAVEHLYYGVQLRKNQEMELIEKDTKLKKAPLPDERTRPQTPLEEGEEGIISDAVLLYEME